MTRKVRHALIRDLAIFWFLVVVVVMVWRNNTAVTVVLIGTYIVRCLLWPNREDHIVFLAGAILGSTAEIIATKVGIWSYTLPTVLNIPLWLPFAWGFVSVLIVRIAQAFPRK